MIDTKKVRFTECGDGLLHHTLGVRTTNHSRSCNWCNKPLKYATQHLCSTCKNRNRLGTLYTKYRGVRELTPKNRSERRKIRLLNTPELQYKINQVLLKTCEQSNFFKTNYYNHYKSLPIPTGTQPSRIHQITRICILYTQDYISNPQHYHYKIEIYYRFLTQAITRYMNTSRKYYSALPTTVSDYVASNVLQYITASVLNK